MSNTAYLVLEDGHTFPGTAFGAPGDVAGEVVFATGMTGYLEALSDASYYGQILVQTFPLIGNYGVIPADFEGSRVWPKGYIVREWCETPSNFRSEGDVNSLLLQNGVAGLCGVDTRALTRIIRERGVMNGVITDNPDGVDFEALRHGAAQNAVANVSTKEARTETPAQVQYKVALWDFGVKENIVRSLVNRGCAVTVLPHNTTAEQVAALAPDGVMLSNGPGDPTDNPAVIEELRRFAAHGIPLFGICLGHQLLALAMGARTHKLKYGHRGANQPVRDVETGRVAITTQNHGYAVDSDSIPRAVAALRYVNANDGTCEGIDYRTIPAFSVQFHPEAAAGPLDTAFLFDRFLDRMHEMHERRGA